MRIRGFITSLLALILVGAGCPGAPEVVNLGNGTGSVTDTQDQCPDDPNKTAPGVCGCGVADVDADGNGIIDCIEPPPGPPAIGSIAGQLSVQAEGAAQNVLEIEPNNTLVQTQTIGSVSAGQHFLISGDAAFLTDSFDAFQFVAASALHVDVSLSYTDRGGGLPADLDVSVHDFKNFNCAPGGDGVASFLHCFDTTNNPETGSFEISGPFILVVTVFSGNADYKLDVAFSSSRSSASRVPLLSSGSAGINSRSPALLESSGTRDDDTTVHHVKTHPFGALTGGFAEVPDTFVPGQLVVKFADSTTQADQNCAMGNCGVQCMERSPSGYARVACSVAGLDANQQRIDTLRVRAILQAQPGVVIVETVNRRYIARVPNDPAFAQQWHYNAINLPAAWDITIGSDDVIVAVIDTGILSQHPDLQDRIRPGFDFISDPVSSRDGDGRDPNPEDPGDLFGGPGQSSFHGTHVAGTIAAATDNGKGVAGVTWKTKLMPLRALGVDGGTDFDVAEAIRYAAGLPNASGTFPANPARIINMSLAGSAGTPASSVEGAAIAAATNAGVLIVAAAGNEDSSQPAFPAADPNVISVAAVDIQLKRASYSNFGSTISLAAPGGFTGTDFNGDGFGDGVLSSGGSDRNGPITFEYIFENGTSMASPHVAGVAALVMAANPALTAAQVRDVLQTTAHDLGSPGRDDQFGFGLVDAAAAVREAVHRAGAATSNTPMLTISNTSLDFGSDQTQLIVGVSNTGGGTLNITSLVPAVTEGSGWLQAQLTGTSASAKADGILVSVDRSGQPAGILHGTVTVNAQDLSPVVINVIMTVGGTASTETIFVLAVLPPPDLTTIGEADTDAARNFAFQIGDLPAGQYVLYAGTDRDNDGFICDDGDLCGALPSMIEPQILTLGNGQQLTGEDFNVSRRVLQQVTPHSNLPRHLKRLH